jgi:putative inorganic carbon (HCO3(-)) transporter
MIATARSAAAPRAAVRDAVPLFVLAAVAGVAAARSPALALGAAVAAAMCAAAIMWPDLATLGVVALVWLNVPALAVDWWGAPQLVGALFPFALLVPLIYGRMRGERVLVNKVFVLIVLLLAAEAVSTALAGHQPEALAKLKEFVLEGVVVYLLVINVVRTPQTLRGALWALLVAGAFLALVTIYQQVRADYYRPFLGFGQVDSAFFRAQDDVARLAGPLGDPNYYAQILLPLIPVGLLLGRGERGSAPRLAARCATVLVLLAVAFTYSRGAALALLVVLVAMTLLGHVRGRHLVAAAAAIGLLLIAVPAYRDRVATIADVGGATAQTGQETTADDSTRSRATEMGAAALAFIHHPLFGVGPDGFPFYYQEYAQRVGIEVRDNAARTGAMAGQLPQREAHNLFIGFAADLGLAGFAAFLAILYITLRDLVRARRRWRWLRVDFVYLADSLFLAVLAYLVAGLFLSLAFERYFWLLLALAGAAGGAALGGRRGVRE